MADQKRVLDEWDVDEILDAARMLVHFLTEGQKKRLRSVTSADYGAKPVMVSAAQMARILKKIEPAVRRG